jgi:hypothetical protein
MTKIVLKSESGYEAEACKKALTALLYPTILAYHESRGMIYVADPTADDTVSRLMEAGVAVEVIKA